MPSLRTITPALAALLAACVLLLTFAAVSPGLHEELCDHAHGDVSHAGNDNSDDAPDCAVMLFAGGVTLSTPPPDLLPPAALSAARIAAFTDILLSRTLRGPERVCGPPARV